MNTTAQVDRVDIAIIGAGIAGAALGAALAETGLAVALLDRRRSPLDTARGDHIQPAVVPILERWGLLARLRAAGAELRSGTRWFDAQQRLIVEVPVPRTAENAPFFLFLNHESIGELLLARALEGETQYVAGLTRWQLDRDPDGWRIDYESPEGAGSLRSTVLVGADGTGSRVRARLGLGETRHQYRYPIAVLYGRPQECSGSRTLDIHLTASRMISLIPRTGGWTKIGIPVDPSELGAWRGQPSEALDRQLRALCPALGFEDIHFGAVYPPVAQQTEPYDGPGAAVLIGDACHAMHPARSMGMNTCFRVAERLANTFAALKPGFSEAQAVAALRVFEEEYRADLAPRLAENHAAGLRMDTLEGDGFAALTAHLRAASRDRNVLMQMARRSAGLSP